MSASPTKTFDSDFFRKALVFSGGVHLSILFSFIVRGFLFPSNTLVFESAMRVDLIALPDKAMPEIITENPQKEEKKASPPVPAPKELPTKELPPLENELDLSKTKKKQKQALDKLKALESIEKMEQEIAPKSNAVKGNQVSSGNDLTGLQKLQYNQYISMLRTHIKKNWYKPDWLKRNLICYVQIFIDEKGFIIGQKMIKSSGHKNFDQLATETIAKASPVPVPAAKYQAILKTEGLTLKFGETE